jgi:2-oxoglutarate dehydrogenase E1 component
VATRDQLQSLLQVRAGNLLISASIVGVLLSARGVNRDCLASVRASALDQDANRRPATAPGFHELFAATRRSADGNLGPEGVRFPVLMASLPISSVFNDGYIAEAYESYRRDPSSVDESWRQYFRVAEQLSGGASSSGGADPDTARKAAGAASLAAAIRTYGHLAVQLDPLGTPPPGAAELTPEFHNIVEADLADVPGSSLGFPHMATAVEVIARLRKRYMGRLGLEYTHISDEHERQWFRKLLTAETLTRPLTPDEKIALLKRTTQVDGLERFLAKAYVGYKRFSVEGTDALIPMLDTAITESATAGAVEVVIGMAHRGRLNVLTNVMGKPYAALFAEFEGRHAAMGDASTGDVKYHMGYDGEREVAGGTRVRLTLVPNPSHLEVVNPVLQGLARARQRRDGIIDPRVVVPVVVHGDAAFPGEGIVPETFNLSQLRGYQVGGTLHIITNNQVGFTTDPIDARSTHYASDVAKGFEVPIIHVNGDDIEMCVVAMRIATAYRQTFGKDFLIDLVGYRRHGHNEGDEPMYTQPTLYDRIKAHPTPRQVWGAKLVADGIVSADEVERLDKEFAAAAQQVLDAVKAAEAHEHKDHHASPAVETIDTAVSAQQLMSLNERLLTWPSDFSPHPRLAKQLERRREAMGDAGGIDWGHAESLAFASLLSEGTSIRLTGQDVERGTFSHRHANLHDVKTGGTYMPLQHIAGAPVRCDIHNSPLSETAVMGFEYGYSTAATDSLTLWEGQFGDFANVAQPIIDQFLVADRAKWGQDSNLVLLLPHGYEGQGPEHSSARLERFLQLCAEENMHVGYPSSPAQYFHALRRQARLRPRRPMVLMQPKSMLRLPAAMSTLADLTTGTFQTVIDDPMGATKRESVRRIVCCTGKIYWELAARAASPDVALVRIEELYPWPHAEVARIVDLYPNVEQVAWVQEEPKNQGAWSFVAPLLRVSAGTALEMPYIGRPERASPAEGYASDHAVEQGRIIDEALTVATKNAGRKRSTATR